MLTSRGQIVDALIARRHDLGLTGEGLDQAAGWSDRYAGKLETPDRPQGRVAFHFDYGSEVLPTGNLRPTKMADIWTEALGLRLVLVDAATADAIGAKPAPPAIGKRRPGWTGGNVAHVHAERRKARGIRPAMTIAAYEAADRTRMTAQTFKASVADHPWLAERPALQERAAKIERDLLDLAGEIAEG